MHCGFFPRNGGSRAPPRGQTQAAAAAATTTWPPRASGVQDSQEVPRSPSLPLRFLLLLLLNPTIQQVGCVSRLHGWHELNRIPMGCSSPRETPPRPLRQPRCRCLCKEHTSRSLASASQLSWSVRVSTRPPGLSEVMNPEGCFPHRNHTANGTSNQSSGQQSGNHLTNIIHKQNN